MAHGDKERRAEAHHFSYVNLWRDTEAIMSCVCAHSEQVQYISTLKTFLCFSTPPFIPRSNRIFKEWGSFLSLNEVIKRQKVVAVYSY